MKSKFLLFLALAIITRSYSQVRTGGSSMFIEDIAGKPMLNLLTKNMEGTPFLIEEWNSGTVTLKDGRIAEASYLRFDAYNNKLYFKRNEEQLEFVDPVAEFTLNVPGRPGKQKLVFRADFPPIERYSTNTFYEVLSDGKFQLLRYVYKTLEEYKYYNESPRQKFVDREGFFVYTDNEIYRVKKDKDDIVNILPRYHKEIYQIADNKKLKLKNTDALVHLFDELNRVVQEKEKKK